MVECSADSRHVACAECVQNWTFHSKRIDGHCLANNHVGKRVVKCKGTMERRASLLEIAFGDLALDSAPLDEVPMPTAVHVMIERFCYTRCPNPDCKKVFYDYDGCDAVYCESCGTEFCSLCGYVAPVEEYLEDLDAVVDPDDYYESDYEEGVHSVHNHVDKHDWEWAVWSHDEENPIRFHMYHSHRRFHDVCDYIRSLDGLDDAERKALAQLMAPWVDSEFVPWKIVDTVVGPPQQRPFFLLSCD